MRSLRSETGERAAILSGTGGNVNNVNNATGARVFQNKLINCLVAPTNFTTHPGPEVGRHMRSCTKVLPALQQDLQRNIALEHFNPKLIRKGPLFLKILKKVFCFK